MPAKKKQNSAPSDDVELPQIGYLDESQLESGVLALKKYIKKSKALKLSCAKRKNLLEAGDKDPSGLTKVIVEVVFKNIPSNSRTYIHNVFLPHHWRLKLEPEDYDIAIFVRHRRPETEAQKIQFSKDREVDIENTHSYYQELFQGKLDESIRSRISRIITTKELATEFNTFQKLDRLSKTYDLFLSDKQLMANKMNSLPRRLGRRFWVREKKVPLMVKLSARNLNERFNRVLSTEPFYVLGRSSTEKIQLGVMSQPDEELVENMKVFLKKLYDLYGDNVRFIRLRTNWGIALPLYADLNGACPKVVMRKRRIKPTPVIDDFDMLNGKARVAVHPDGTVRVIRPTKRKLTTQNSSPDSKPAVKRVRKST